jgi:hypothetical protein
VEGVSELTCDKCGSEPTTPFDGQMLCDKCKVWLYGMLLDSAMRRQQRTVSPKFDAWREITEWRFRNDCQR